MSNDNDAALDCQQTLLENCLEEAFAAYDQGLNSGSNELVVFLLDCEDPIGSQIARSWLGPEAVEQAIEDVQSQRTDTDETTVFATTFSWVDSQREVPQVFPLSVAGVSGRVTCGRFPGNRRHRRRRCGTNRSLFRTPPIEVIPHPTSTQHRAPSPHAPSRPHPR